MAQSLAYLSAHREAIFARTSLDLELPRTEHQVYNSYHQIGILRREITA